MTKFEMIPTELVGLLDGRDNPLMRSVDTESGRYSMICLSDPYGCSWVCRLEAFEGQK